MAVAENDGQDQVETNDLVTGDDADSAMLQTETEGDDTGETDDEEQVVVTIGEESPPSNEDENLDAPGLVNKLRKLNREKDRELRELRAAKAATPATSAPAETAKVDKPTLAGCEYDEDEFETKLTAWHKQQAKAEEQQRAQADRQKAEQDAWQGKLANHGKAKAALKVADYDEAEAVVSETLSVTQRAIIVSGADNSAIVEYALGKNPAKAKELASITDPVKFAFAIAKLETQLKVTPRKAPPPPEKHVRGNAPVAGGGDATLERLRDEAAKTGDLSKVIAYKQQKRAA
ncbi:MAG: hypothetical protein V4641_01710 [Pseudomonadota bacterium]